MHHDAPAPPLAGSLTPGGRHAALVSLAGTVRRRGCDEDEIFALLVTVNERRCDPPKSDDELRHIAHSVCRYAPQDVPWEKDLVQTVTPVSVQSVEEAWAWLR
jgi:hypothetical protein